MRVEAYDLDLAVDYPDGTFRGDLKIELVDPSSTLELDALGLAVERVDVGGATVPVRVDAERQKLIVPLAGAEARTVRIRYSATAGRNVLTGFYISQFGERPLLTTMMEPVGCRRFMPCLDSPEFKAVFRLRVTTAPELTVISNAPVAAREGVGDRVRWTFAPTPRMSTYLLYLGVGPFEERAVVAEGTRIIAATAPGRAGRTAWALDVAARVLPAFREYYGLPYPIEKLHLVGVPDIASGAMENWGAITFSELALLVDDATVPTIRRWACESIVHEIAHQWFGNLVTMESFNDLWLNEAFATFVTAKMQDQLGLRADAWGEFAIRATSGWIGDSVRAAHPVKADVTDPAQITELFDEITYFKGSSLLRMLETYVGEGPFRRGVQAYLQGHLYGNARGEDLWRALAEATGLPIERVARDWVERSGHPVVRVHVADGGVRLEQQRFLFDSPAPAEPPRPIPLRLTVRGQPSPVLFDEPSLTVAGVDPARDPINPLRAGFFRVWYEPTLRPKVLARSVRGPDLELWGFLHDTAAFLLSGDVTVGDYLASVRAAEGATGYASVSEVSDSLQSFLPLLHDHPGFLETARSFFGAQIDRLTLRARPGEPEVDGLLREGAAVGRVVFDTDFARTLAEQFPTVDHAEPALRPAITIAAARAGPVGVVDELVRRIGSENENAAEDAARAIGNLPTSDGVARGLAAWKDRGVRTSTVAILVRRAAGSVAGAVPAWEWVERNLVEYDERAREATYLSRMLKGAIPYMGLVRPREVRQFFTRRSFPEAAVGIAQGLEFLGAFERLHRSVGSAHGSAEPVAARVRAA
ncbi:MAG TPA: M1 family metallopeptidase [Thermoplasmata archaeon]|nr:M1 family metallopeptidase [Thermoplasmata archaeon]